MPDDSAPAPAPAAPISPELAAVAEKIEAGAGASTAGSGDAGLAAPELQAPSAAMSREDADALARLGLNWILDAVTRQYPVLVYPPETRDRGARLAGAVLVKYDVLAWAGRWRAEFELGVFVAGLAWESYQRINAPPAVPDQAPAAAGESQSPVN